MLVKELIEFLKTCDENKSIIGQYKDSNGSWPMGYLEATKVNDLVVIQTLNFPVEKQK